MRAVTGRAISALLNREPGRFDRNTEVREHPNAYDLALHRNRIAFLWLKHGGVDYPGVKLPSEYHGWRLEITTAGWDTSTTRERLNGIPGVSVYHKRGELYLNGEEWNGDPIDVTDRAHESLTAWAWHPQQLQRYGLRADVRNLFRPYRPAGDGTLVRDDL